MTCRSLKIFWIEKRKRKTPEKVLKTSPREYNRYMKDASFIVRLLVFVLTGLIIVFAVIWLFNISGFGEKFGDTESFRKNISGYGLFAVPAFILLQILQVVLLPIPGSVAVAAGVYMFGWLLGGLYSVTGILSGSVIAYETGRRFGHKAVCWLVGEKTLYKSINAIKGKDKIALFTMFLLPCFPDDVLCFAAGIMGVERKSFILLTLTARTFSIFTVAAIADGKIIPYNTVGGIICWCVLIVIAIFSAAFIMKRGEKIERFISDKFRKLKNAFKRGNRNKVAKGVTYKPFARKKTKNKNIARVLSATNEPQKYGKFAEKQRFN